MGWCCLLRLVCWFFLVVGLFGFLPFFFFHFLPKVCTDIFVFGSDSRGCRVPSVLAPHLARAIPELPGEKWQDFHPNRQLGAAEALCPWPPAASL